MPRKVDHNAIRTNQAFIITLLLLAFILDVPLLVAFVSVVLAVGTAVPEAALFKRIYKHILVPAGLLKPDVIDDNPEPHNFSQGLGALFTGLSFVALIVNASGLGWALSWLVIVLASLNLFAGFCAGCFVYYQLSRRQVPGFTRLPIHE